MKKFQFEVGYKGWYEGLYGGRTDFEVVARTENTVTFRKYWTAEDTWELCHDDKTYDTQIEESYGCQIEWVAIWEYCGHVGHQYCIDEDKFEEIRNEFNKEEDMRKQNAIDEALKIEDRLTEIRGYASGMTADKLAIFTAEELEEMNAQTKAEIEKFEKENDTMTTINLTNNTASFTYDGITYRVNLETNRYSKVVGGKTTRIGKAEFEAAQNAKMAETEAKMHESLDKLCGEITEEDIERDARELEAYISEAEESTTDEETKAIIEAMDADAEDDSISAEEFLEKVQKVEKQKQIRKAKKAKAAKKNAAFTYCPNGTDVITLTEKQVDFIRHLPDTCFWEQGLDSCIWVDCLCDEIKGQFENKPMTVGAMISTICEKGLGVRATDRKGPRGGKYTSFALTDMGKQVAAELGLN